MNISMDISVRSHAFSERTLGMFRTGLPRLRKHACPVVFPMHSIGRSQQHPLFICSISPTRLYKQLTIFKAAMNISNK